MRCQGNAENEVKKKVANLNTPEEAHIASITVKTIVFEWFLGDQESRKCFQNDPQNDGLGLYGTPWKTKNCENGRKNEALKNDEKKGL